MRTEGKTGVPAELASILAQTQALPGGTP